MTNYSLKTKAREYAFKFLYSLFLDKTKQQKTDLVSRKNYQESLLDFNQTYFEPDQEHPTATLDQESQNFAISLISGTLEDEEALRGELIASLHKWKIEQLDKVDLTLLLMAQYELKHMALTPPKVVIIEAINLSIQYGSIDSAGFINGLLDTLAQNYGHKTS